MRHSPDKDSFLGRWPLKQSAKRVTSSLRDIPGARVPPCSIRAPSNFQSTWFAHLWPLPSQGCWVSLGIGRSVQTQKGSPFGGCLQSLWDTAKPQSRVHHFSSRRMCHSFTQAPCRVSKVRQKMCKLRKQRVKALSILTLSWRSRRRLIHSRASVQQSFIKV